MKVIDNIAIISLGKDYDMNKLAEIVEISTSTYIKQMKGIIIDASELENINVMGLEVLDLKNNLDFNYQNNLVFYGLKSETRKVLEMLDSNKEYGELFSFISMSEAIQFINERVQSST